jgi:nucleoside-diphosphate-sugar epimerase
MALSFSSALVTGGAGFIGSHLVENLVHQGCSVTVLDNLTSGHLRNLEQVASKITFIRGDIRDLQVILQASKGCDAVFHHAAVVSVTKTVEDPIGSAEVNEAGTLNVLEAARRNGAARLVLASSSAIYGDDPQLPKAEAMAPVPLSPYAVQKLTNEYYARLYHRLYGLKTVCLRYFNVFGPRQDPGSPYSGVISIFMTRASRNLAPVIYGDGRQTRDFVFVGDVVRANLLAAGKAAAVGEVFNIGTGCSVSINDLWHSIARLGACRLPAEYADPRSGDIVHSLAGIEKAGRYMGFEPAVKLEEGLQRTYDWYRQGV